MSNYVQTTFFTPKDTLPTTNPAKTIYGAAYDVEFGNIATAITSKYDSTSIATNPVGFGVGSVTAPSIYFGTATTSGFYGDGSSGVSLTTSGVARVNVSSAGAINFYAPASGTTLVVAGAAGSFSMGINASTTAGSSYGLSIHAGTSAGDVAFVVGNAAVTSTFFSVTGAGQTSMTCAVSGDTACTVSGASSAYQLYIQSGNSSTTAYPDMIIARAGSTANSVEEGPSISLYDSTNSTQTCFQQSGGQTELWQYNGGWNQIFKIDSARQITLNQGSSTYALTINGASSNATLLNLQQYSASQALFSAGYSSTGTATATLAANKPGANRGSSVWLSVSISGSGYWIPAWLN